YNSSTGCYEKTFSTALGSQIAAGTINFKVVENGDSDGWDGGSYPSGNTNQTYVINANPTSVTFSFNPTTEKTTVTQTNDDSVTGEWEPTTPDVIKGNITDKSSSDNTNVIYGFGTGSSVITSGSIKNPKMVGSDYWVDFSDLTTEIGNVNTTQGYNLYIALTAGSDFNNIYTESGSVVYDNQTYSLGVSGGSIQNYNVGNTRKYFACITFENPNTISHLGVLISKPSGTQHNFKVYTTAQAPEPVTEAKVVDIYAKNGTLRDSTFNRFINLADTNIEDYFYYEETVNDVTTEYTSVAAYNAAHAGKEIVVTHNVAYGNSSYDKMTNVPVGAKIKLKTTLSSNASDAGSFNNQAFKDTHYLKAYSFNGMTYELHEANSTGVYEETWTVRAVNTTYHDANDILQNAMSEGKAVEVTPIYYMQDTTNTKTFYIDGYDGEVQNAWGNMLAVYPYYEGKSNSANAFGGYPGQPMLLWGGKYQMEIPLTVDGTASGASVKGLTLHNAYWDLLHRSLNIRCNARNHAQTYDYDDFYKLYKEYDPDTIIFDFKYRTKTDNYNDGYNYTNYSFAGTAAKSAADFASQNGVEIVTDYFGRQVDAFGTLITDGNQSDYDSEHPQDKELLFVSTG
ncbi:MAG: hypothetical protein IJH36_00405, partial [Clostridia bacterium]|nr:hypothetical protein [Clostridia bacterium]